jgi:hypothetical protein
MKLIAGRVQSEHTHYHAWAVDRDPCGPLLQGYGHTEVEAVVALDIAAAEAGYKVTYRLGDRLAT